MKKIELSEEAEVFLICIVGIIVLGGLELGYPYYLVKQKEKARIKEKYNKIEVLKYSGDTLEFVFHSSAVHREFRQEWKVRNYGQNIQNNPVSDNMRVLKYNDDTIQIKFEDARFQRQFEKQWRKYSDHKLNHINQNIKKR